MRRREFISLVGPALLSTRIPVTRAQRSSAARVPVVGFLTTGSRDGNARTIPAFIGGLRSAGYVEGQNVQIEYRFTDGDYGRVRLRAAELIELPVDVLACPGGSGKPDGM